MRPRVRALGAEVCSLGRLGDDTAALSTKGCNHKHMHVHKHMCMCMHLHMYVHVHVHVCV
mgnify:FL=1